MTTPGFSQTPALLADPPDGSEVNAPEARVVFRPAVVEETTVHQQGGRTITVQRLALDPRYPVRPAATAAPTPAPIQDNQSPGEFSAPAHLLFLSATVHPGHATRLSWTHNYPDGTAKEFSGWSNIDFNHLSGINTFLATDGEPRSFILAAGTVTNPAENVPAFPTTAPTFIPGQKDIPTEALITVESLHKLYAIEHEKLAAAHAGRERTRLATEAELLANPPQPKDLIIRYRIAETPAVTDSRGQTTETR